MDSVKDTVSQHQAKTERKGGPKRARLDNIPQEWVEGSGVISTTPLTPLQGDALGPTALQLLASDNDSIKTNGYQFINLKTPFGKHTQMMPLDKISENPSSVGYIQQSVAPKHSHLKAPKKSSPAVDL